MKQTVIFSRYEIHKVSDGVVAHYAGTVDGKPFEADENSVTGLSVKPGEFKRVVMKARVIADNGGPKVVEI